ncbi:MAG: hypothetical protein LBJ62_00785 [Bifidobacteriaceae bacterium]|jgi:hypothetical protein|nr:hypothetical protein [Bifidobacteriaceae bacterium]
MITVNNPLELGRTSQVKYSLSALGATAVSGQEDDVQRIAGVDIGLADFALLQPQARYLGVSARFRDVLETFPTPTGHTPAGFRFETSLRPEGLVEVDLVRDISYDQDGIKRPTNLIFSADSANPYEVAPIAPLLGNLTCNPGIVYDLFINNPEANVGHAFDTREEVMAELGRILGPGCDISVELNNPFEEDFSKLLDEAEEFREMLSPYRVVIKVPHTGPVNASNVQQLMRGDKRLSVRYDQPATADALRGHNLALRLRQHGFRINYTLMFEPYQTALALQAKPAFINSFVRHRAKQSAALEHFIAAWETTKDQACLRELRSFLLANDYLAAGQVEYPLLDCLKLANDLLRYRHWSDPAGQDGLDAVRQNLRWLRQVNLPDTRLIICSMEGEYNYPDIDNLLADPQWADMVHRVVLTAEPSYLARFTSSNLVVTYQRRFMNAAATAR